MDNRILNQGDLHWLATIFTEDLDLVLSRRRFCGALGLLPAHVEEIEAAATRDRSGCYDFFLRSLNKWMALLGNDAVLLKLIDVLDSENFKCTADAVLEKAKTPVGVRVPKGDTNNVSESDATESIASTASFFTKSLWFGVPDPGYLFTGRLKELDSLHEAVLEQSSDKNNNNDTGSTKASPVITALVGMGGVGKTALCIRYALTKHPEFERNVVWINSATLAKTQESFDGLIKTLMIDKRSHETVRMMSWNFDEVLDQIYGHFSTTKVIFIFDNVGKYDDIKRYLPKSRPDKVKPFVLVNSRNLDWPENTSLIKLDVFDKKDSKAFLIEYLGLETKEERKCANSIAALLQNLPLAIRQAGAYIKNQKYLSQGQMLDHMTAYIHEFQAKRDFKSILNFRSKANSNEQTTYTTWLVTMKEIKAQDRLAVRIMEMAAYLNPDNIPNQFFTLLRQENEGLFQRLLHLSTPTLSQKDQCVVDRRSLTFDEDRVNQAMKLLSDYSMIVRNPYTFTFNVHRLVQQVVRILVEKKHEHERLKQVVDLIQQILLGTQEYRDFEKNCLIHSITVKQHVEAKNLSLKYHKLLNLIDYKQKDSMNEQLHRFSQLLKLKEYTQAFKIFRIIVQKHRSELLKLGLQVENMTRRYIVRFVAAVGQEIELISHTYSESTSCRVAPILSQEFKSLVKEPLKIRDRKTTKDRNFEALRKLVDFTLNIAERSEGRIVRSELFGKTLAAYLEYFEYYKDRDMLEDAAQTSHGILTCLAKLNRTDDILEFVTAFKFNLSNLDRKLSDIHPEVPYSEWVYFADLLIAKSKYRRCTNIKCELAHEALYLYSEILEYNLRTQTAQSFQNILRIAEKILACYKEYGSSLDILNFQCDLQYFLDSVRIPTGLTEDQSLDKANHLEYLKLVEFVQGLHNFFIRAEDIIESTVSEMFLTHV